MYLEIDGLMGEGGGQVLRTSLALSAVTKLPFRMENIRGNRSKPGLMRQHLTCVEAAAAVCGAEVRGAELRSRALEFIPGELKAGYFELAIGSAGSTTLVLQSILPALLVADAPSHVKITGGTHNPLAPTVDFLNDTYLPLLRRLGPEVVVRADRIGFYPAGGGVLIAEVTPRPLAPFDLLERGDLIATRCEALVGHVRRDVAEREIQTLTAALGWSADVASIRDISDLTPGPGNALTAQLKYEHVTETFTGLGERGVPAERVASDLAAEVGTYLDTGAPVGAHLADQLVLLLALAGGGAFRTGPLSLHTKTQLELIPKFLEVDITAEPLGAEVWEVRVER